MKKLFFLILPMSLLVSYVSCQNQGTDTTSNNADSLTSSATTTNGTNSPALLDIDTSLSNLAFFIAGRPVLSDSLLVSYQKADFYKSYLEFIHETWDSTRINRLEPIKQWTKENNITEAGDTNTLFYPFSGPDFLFANTFFPQAKDYVMIALEQRGSLPDFSTMNEAKVKSYFTNLQQSLRYLNKAGYFVTQHMGSDFYNTNFDGVMHMLFYFLGRTNHYILDVNTVYVDANGNEQVVTDDLQAKNFDKLLRIDFCDSARVQKRRLYYLSIDISDSNVKNKTELWKFLGSFPKKVTYMKAASCILQNHTFSVIRQFILDESVKVLQDDTGMPFRYFDENTFSLELYGTYSRQIDDLSWCYQPDLKKALQSSDKYKPLPFKISYIGFFSEGMLMYAKRK